MVIAACSPHIATWDGRKRVKAQVGENGLKGLWQIDHALRSAGTQASGGRRGAHMMLHEYARVIG